MSTPSNPGYETIPNDDDAENEEPMELSTSRTSSNIDDDGPFNIRLYASGLFLLILAFLGGRSSMRIGGGKGSIEDDVHLNKEAVPTRLCEIYHDPKSKDSPSNIRMIQTSLSEPSKQWSDVSCIHRTLSSSSSSNNSRRKLHPSDTSHDNNYYTPEDDGGYTNPSAIINVNFDNVAFPEREPILGFGGAFTEAAALNFGSLNKEGKNVALELLFGRDGLGYRYVSCFGVLL